MRIILLGTGAATPTLLRWPTATAIMRGGEILLFDCGEGTQVQFLRAKLKPGKLTRIFISHFHGDHINGLVGLLTSLQLTGRDKEIHLYSPIGLAEYLQYMQKLSQFSFVYPIYFHEVPDDADKVVWDLGQYTVTAMPLSHRVRTLGYRLEEKEKPGRFDEAEAERLGIGSGPLRGLLQKGEPVRLPDGSIVRPEQLIGPRREGKKTAICLDTEPCANAIKLADDADVLIHESTFVDDKTEWAEDTGHSTATQAAWVAKEAGAHKLILTHISARYDRSSEVQLLQEAQKVFANTVVGFDLMREDIYPRDHPSRNKQ